MLTIDINCDMGESFGAYKIGSDTEVMAYISSANLACGFHAGDPVVMRESVRMAKEHGVRIGAHPGFPDLMGFGRRAMKLSTDEVEAYIIYQIGSLMGFARSAGIELQHVKPHGMLYNMAVEDRKLAESIARAIAKLDRNLILVALSNSEYYAAGVEAGLRVAGEVFADRGYAADGSLLPRGKEGALIKDPHEAARRVVSMVKEGKVAAVTGEMVKVKADTVCLHGDNPEVVTFVRTIKETLTAEGIKVVPMLSSAGK